MSVVMDIHGNYIDTDFDVELLWLGYEDNYEVISLDDEDSMLEYYEAGKISKEEMLDYGYEV